MRNTQKAQKGSKSKSKSKSAPAKGAAKGAIKKAPPKKEPPPAAQLDEWITLSQQVGKLEEKLTTLGDDLEKVSNHLDGFDGPIERIDEAVGDVEFLNGPDDPLYKRVKRIEAIVEAIAGNLGIDVPPAIEDPEVDGGDPNDPADASAGGDPDDANGGDPDGEGDPADDDDADDGDDGDSDDDKDD